jgi:hypothetical protein
MSATAIIAGAIALVVVAGVLIWLLLSSGDITADGQPGNWPGTNAAQEWDEKARGAGSDFGLKSIRDTAGKWATSIAALLGVLSTVAFVAGPSDLVKDVGGDAAEIAAWLILAAAAAAAIATLLAALAEQGVPKQSEPLTGWTFRSLTQKRAEEAAGQLMASRLLTIVALLCVITATGIAWLSAVTGDEPAATQSAIATLADGAACGSLTKQGDRVALTIGNRVEEIPPSAHITLVDACP